MDNDSQIISRPGDSHPLTVHGHLSGADTQANAAQYQPVSSSTSVSAISSFPGTYTPGQQLLALMIEAIFLCSKCVNWDPGGYQTCHLQQVAQWIMTVAPSLKFLAEGHPICTSPGFINSVD